MMSSNKRSVPVHSADGPTDRHGIARYRAEGQQKEKDCASVKDRLRDLITHFEKSDLFEYALRRPGGPWLFAFMV